MSMPPRCLALHVCLSTVDWLTSSAPYVGQSYPSAQHYAICDRAVILPHQVRLARPTALRPLTMSRVEHIADSMNVASDLNFSSLSTSIQSLIAGSKSLDVQKFDALDKLRKLLPKSKSSQHGVFGCIKRGYWMMRASCGSQKGQDRLRQMELWREPSVEEQLSVVKHHSRPSPPMKNIKEIKKVLLEIRGINQKLKGFEGGFISEEGIKVSTV